MRQGYCRVRVTVPVAVSLPEVRVTVTVYVPAVVPELPPLLLPLPQASKPPVRARRKTTIPILVCHLRRRAGIPLEKSMAKARSPVPLAAAAYPLTPGLTGCARALVAAVGWRAWPSQRIACTTPT
jgi:hypothetical protein